MSVTAAEAEMLRASFHDLRKNMAPASVAFYEALFAKAPELRKMFRDDIAGQGMRFMTTLGAILTGIEHSGSDDARIATLGQGHRLMGVKPEHFAPMGAALIETLQGELGNAFTPELKTAWEKAYSQIAESIIAASRAA